MFLTYAVPIFMLGIGLVIIIKGGDFFVDAASWIAEISGMPRLIVGATVVSFATTLPELLTSALAAAQAHAESNPSLVDMAIGNAIGSVSCNLGLILGISLVCIPTVIKRRDYALKMALMIGASVTIVLFGYIFNGIGVVSSIILLAIFAVAMWDNIKGAVEGIRESKSEHTQASKPTKKTVIINIIKFIVGAAGIIVGANLLVNYGQELAKLFGVNDRIISVTIIAVGTSLPELVTTITAIVKKQASMSAGNIIGANIIDLTLILPVCALIYGGTLPVTPTVATIDLPACLIIGAIAVVPTIITKKFARWQGFALLAEYAVYMLFTVFIFAA